MSVHKNIIRLPEAEPFHNKKELDGITRSALWDKNDFKYHCHWTKKLRATPYRSSRQLMINELVDHVDALYNDHRTHKLNIFKEPHKQFEAFNTSINKNKTTIYACIRHSEIITEESTKRFYWMASGTSVEAKPLAIDRKLNLENIRVSLKDNGFLFSNQNVIMEHGVFPYTIADALIKEFGAFDSPSTLAANQYCEWHNLIKFSNEYHDHKQNQTYYTATHSMELRPSNRE